MLTILRALLVLLLFQVCGAQTNTTQGEPKPYDSLITPAAKSQPGLVTVHRVGERYYYEIPASLLERDLLLVVQVAAGKLGTGDGGGEAIDQRIVRWQRRENKVYLLDIDYSVWADPKLPVARAVASANQPTILQSFNLEAVGKQDSCVVEVSKLYASEVLEISPKRLLGARIFDKERSYVERILAFPDNIEVESVVTMTNPETVRVLGPRREMGYGSATVRLRHSLLRLPEKPMMGRLRDNRVGYFASWQTDFGRPEHVVQPRGFLARWRLEKRDPQAAVSEPIKPIVFYIDPATPEVWVPFIKRGVEQWQPAFEEAGFKQAIVAREAPREPGWSPEDARYSVIRWVASETANAYGPHISDPRSGEILEADIHLFHNILDLLRRWYITQVGHLDPRVSQLPMPDELMGRLLEFVVTHEVGHSLGLAHNMRASSTYTLAQVRDRNWVQRMGHCPSIMDYCRFNYVAQPEDKIALEDLVPRLGVYDRFAIMWGYRPIPQASTPEQELPTLDGWARWQDQQPHLRFSNLECWGLDPGDQTEAVGDADPVEATRLGVKNLKRILPRLLTMTGQPGQPYDELLQFRRQIMTQWSAEMHHVVPLIGGIHKQTKVYGQSGAIFSPIPRQRQWAALEFLLSQAFVAQDWLLETDSLRLTYATGAHLEVSRMQRRLLHDLVTPARLNHMAEQWTEAPQLVLAPHQFLDRLRQGMFQELPQGRAINLARRNLQRSLVDVLVDISYSSGEARNLAQDQLRRLLGELRSGLVRVKERQTQAHLAQLLEDVQRELDPCATGRKDEPLGTRFSDMPPAPDSCWKDAWPWSKAGR